MANQSTPVIQIKDSNVGIGTISPSNKLHIDSAEDNAYALRVQGNTNNGSGVWTGIGLAGEVSNTKIAILFQDIGTSYSRGRLIFSLNNAEDQTNATPANAVMTLQPGGNVLIGTTTDSGYKLDVNGTARLGALTGTSAAFSSTITTTDGFQGRYFKIFEATAQRGGFYTYNVLSGAGTDYSVGLFSESTMWFAAGGGVTKNLQIAANGEATFSSSVTASSLIKSGGTSSQYLMADGSVSTTSNVAPRYVATVNVSQTTYTQICTITGGSLASAVNMSFQGTSGNVVVNVTAQILVNHSQDISITTTSGFYSQLNLRVISNNNETYSVEAQVISGVGATTDLNIEVFPLNSESVTFGGSPISPGTTLIHTTRQGFYISASEGISISSGNDIYAAGNVGIGTTTPNQRLSVEGGNFQFNANNAAANYYLYINKKSGQDGGFIFNRDNGSDWQLTNGAGNGDLIFYSYGTASEAITFKRATGNVLIGTTTDNGYKFRVNGKGYFDSNVVITPTSESWAEGLSFVMPTTGTWGGIRWRRERAGNDGNWYVGFTALDTTDDLVFGANNGGSQVDNIIRLTKAGNVGIGTTAPDYNLDVYAANTPVLRIQSQNSSGVGNPRLLMSRGGEETFQINVEPNVGVNFKAVVADAGYMDFYTGTNAVTMRLSSSKNVLIGTTTDSGYKLAVAGNVVLGYAQNRPVFYDSNGGNFQIKANAGGWATGYFFQGSSGTFRGGWGGFGSADTLGYLWAGDAYDSPTIVVQGAQGNVGIGTTEPSNKLTVTRSAATQGSETTYGLRVVQGKPITIGGDNDYAYIQSWSSGPLSINAQGNSVLFPNAGSNVIIGSTTDAGYKLDVHGEILGRDDIRILNTYALVLNGSDNNWRIGRNTITDSGWLTSNTLQVVVFGGSSGQGFQVVNSNGTALFEIDGVAGASRFTNALGVGVNPSGTAGRIDASNDIVAYSSSDLRLKENIKPIENALDKVKALTGVEFDWKAEHKEAHGHEGHDTGVIAQEVQEVMPTAVRTNDTGYLAVRYEKLIGLLIEANKELAYRVEHLESKLK